MKYPSYPEMKDSGVEWLGEIPEHWDVINMKWVLELNESGVWGDNPDDNDEINNVTVLRSTEIDLNGSWSLTDPAKRNIKNNNLEHYLLKEGDLLITKSSGSEEHIGKTALVNKEIDELNCTFSNFMQRLRTKKFINSKFLYYYLNSYYVRNQLFYYSLTTTGLKNLSAKSLGKLDFFILPFDEQKTIANFLDQETERIDKLIKKKEKLIELLEEKRQAIINKAVTKGLDPDVPMKDSGIEWLEKIPEHWEHTKLKFITKKIIDGVHITPEYIEEGIPFLRVSDITKSNGDCIDLENVKYISKEEHEKLKKRCNPEKGDLLLSKNGTIGVPRVVDWNYEFSIFVSLCLIKFNDNYNVEFASYFFKSSIIDSQIYIGSKTNTVTNLHLNKISEFYFPIPSFKEQNEIVDYLDEKTEQIEELSTKIQKQIANLKEYRQALITNAVTGKIDVRDMV